MKILHLIYDHASNPWVGGGAAVRAQEIYGRLAARHEITLVCGAYPGAKDYTEGRVRHIFLGTRHNNYVLSTFCYAARAALYVREHAQQFDAVVEDFAPYNPLFSFFFRKDAVVQLHQREGLRHLKKYALLGLPFLATEKYYPRFFKNAVSISELSRKGFGLEGRAVLIPNGFDSALLEQETVERDYVLFLGRLHIGQKGLDTLCEAIRLVAGRLVIAGKGKDDARVRALFSEEVKAGRVEFRGFVSGHSKSELLSRCMMMVIPSRYEGQPLTIIEAAACGKAVIVSDIPELGYAVKAGFGISFRTGDAGDLAAKMDTLLRDPYLRREMGRRGRAYARNFTWDRMAEEYECFLQEIAYERGAGHSAVMRRER